MLKTIKKPNKIKLFWAVPILLFPVLTSALSLSSFFNFMKGSSSEQKEVSSARSENLQTLKVLESNKVFAENSEMVDISRDLVQEGETSFVVHKEFVDDLDSDSRESRLENAIYTVQKGDSIYSIASYFGVSHETIMSYNHKKVITVRVGEVLEVPSSDGILYPIKKGDTLKSIAKKYSVDEDEVTLYNGIVSASELAVGEEIFLPNAKVNEQDKKPTSQSKNTKVSGINVLSYIPKKYVRGDTSHLNTPANVKKFLNLPKYDGYFLFPAPGSKRTQKMHGHNGVDFANKVGSPVLAAASGVVSVAKTGGYNFGYGNYVKITHGNGSETIYGHMAGVDVVAGQAVSKGQQIGTVGSTGNSTGPHLHFEIRGAYNPFAW
jgi:LysM repeat protein